MEQHAFDLCVIGAGPGGYVAAIRAGQRGAKVALIEKAHFGGTCLNIGCIPTKTLIAGTEILHKVRHAADFGVSVEGEIKADWGKMQARKGSVVETLRKGIAGLLKGAGVTVFNGEASFLDRKAVQLSGTDGKAQKISAKNFIIAVGSEALVPGFVPKSERVLTSTELLSIDKIPKSLLVLGGGVIGCEFACLFAELGTEVTVVEMLPSILPMIDAELSKALAQQMKKQGIKILTGQPLQDIKADKNGVSGNAGGESLSAEYLLVSVGRKAVSASLNPAAAGITLNERGWIPVDSRCRTNVPGIYAIGDCTGAWQLAHAASAMGICAAENACASNSEFKGDLVPGCIFTSPEIGSIGLSEEDCAKKNISVRTGKFPFASLGKAMAINETSGFCKIIADAANDQVLGVHIIGPHATDLISEAVPALSLEITAAELGKAIHAHPTLGEAMMEAAHAVHGECIHAPAPRKRG
ncbi:MAG: dihydrolipoyl dehydrogenase [Lentisphaerae bacterium GWF2_52_8]|nr:MAG: dihydrolipoyl dehydrogenase [Lentisphaerae bacterium GWF2_52_8]